MDLDLQRHPHRRRNLLTGEWVLVSPHRTSRPWQGQTEAPTAVAAPEYDPACYMCPGNTRASGERNPRYTSTFVFTNDFPALQPDTPRSSSVSEAMLLAHGETGECRVVCFSPRHDLTLSRMPATMLREVVDCWAAESRRLGAGGDIAYVEIFENRGAMMGASNPHPHGQIWATSFIPDQVAKEAAMQSAYIAAHGGDLLSDYAAVEERRDQRVIHDNGHFICVVPFWAVWPFETLLIARRDVGTLDELRDDERDALADILQRTTATYDRLFNAPFPYSMGFHERPPRAGDRFRLHAHFYPPLLRSATVRKHMVGFELLAMPQRDITPEQAAADLKRVTVTSAAEPPSTTTLTR